MLLKNQSSASKPVIFDKAYTVHSILITLNVGIHQLEEDENPFRFHTITISRPRSADFTYADLLQVVYDHGVAGDMTSEEYLIIAEGMGESTPISAVLAVKRLFIEEYDTSPAVNSFTYQGQPMWIKLEERQKARISIDAHMTLGTPTISYFMDGVEFQFPTELFDMMMKQLEVYAQQCYAVTARHKIAVSGLDSVEAVLAYDHTQGYPAHLEF